MNKFYLLCLLLLTTVSFSLAADDMDDTIIALEAGYRHDQFQIKTDFTDNPLIVTNQDWKNVNSWTLGLYADTFTEYNIYYKGKISYGWAYKSDLFWESGLLNSDIFHSKTQPHGRNYEAEIAVGLPCWWNCFCSNTCSRECWIFIPLIGFSWDRMDFKSRGRFEDDIEVLKTKAHNHVVFYSPYIGFDLQIPCDCWRFVGGYEFHLGRMNSHAKIKGKDSFEFRTHDTGKGYGHEAHAGIGYEFWCDYELFLSFSYTDWRVNHGHDHTRFTLGDNITKNEVNLKKASWQSWKIAVEFITLY